VCSLHFELRLCGCCFFCAVACLFVFCGCVAVSFVWFHVVMAVTAATTTALSPIDITLTRGVMSQF